MICAPLGAEHKNIVAALHQEAFEEHWSAAEFGDLITLPASFGWLAVDKEEPLGFVLCQGDEVEAEIITIATRPAARRQGVATILLRNIFTRTRRLFLEVAADNISAQTFYEKSGFAQIGVRKNYYKRESGSIDALILAKDR